MKKSILLFCTGTAIGIIGSKVINGFDFHQSENNQLNPYLKFVDFGLPSTHNLEYYQEYITSIDYTRRIPSWTGYSLSQEVVKREPIPPRNIQIASASNSTCKKAPIQFQAKYNDYYDSGWRRGQLTPIADHHYNSQEAMEETYILSANVVPQHTENSGTYFYRIEHLVRDLAKRFDFVHIITGPLFIPIERRDMHPEGYSDFRYKYLSYPVIGDNEVHVPTHLFKCILVENKNKSAMACGCFVVPNQPIDRNRPLTDFAVTREEVERRTGLEIFRQNVDLKTLPFLCDHTSCELTEPDEVTPKMIEQGRYARKIRRCKTVSEVKKIWREIEHKRYDSIYQPLFEAYNKKISELTEGSVSSKT